MTITDEELTYLLAGVGLTVTRSGTGAIIVQQVTRKYSTALDSIVFGAASGGVAMITSKTREAGMPQIELKSYATAADFAGPAKGVPRLEVPAAVSPGTDIVVTWYPDIYSDRLSHANDWLGLFRKGDCADETTTQSNRLHKCYLGWKYTPKGLNRGETRFAFEHYKQHGDYEVRYFYGDSTDGQGYRCITLGGISDTFRQCVLSARQTSSVITVSPTGTASSMTGVPGLIEKACDGSKRTCE